MWYRRLAGPTTVTILAGTVVAAATISALAGIADGTRPTFAQSFSSETFQIGYNRQQLARDDKASALYEEGQYELDADEAEEAQRIFEKLIEQFPNSKYTAKAQRYLERLQRRNRNDPALQPIAKSVDLTSNSADWRARAAPPLRSLRQRRPKNFVQIVAFSSSCSMRLEIAYSSHLIARISGPRRVVRCAIRRPG